MTPEANSKLSPSTGSLRRRLGLTRSRHFTPEIASPWARMLIAVAISTAGIVACTYYRDVVDPERFPLFGFASVVLSAWLGRLLAAVVSTSIWILAGSYVFAAPVGSFRVERAEDAFALFAFALISMAMGLLAESSHASWRRGLRLADERQSLAEDLLRERNRLELLLANLPGIVFELKVEPDTWPPRVRYVSANAWRLTGFPPDRWRRVGLLWEELLPVDERPAFEEAVRTAIRRGNANHSHRFRHADGATRSFETHLSSRPGRAEAEHVVHGVALDVTALEDAERAVAETERRFRSAADRAPIMIWIAAPERGNLWCNRAWLDFRGRTLDQELGAGWREGVHPEDTPRLAEIVSEAYAAQREFRIEFRIRRADGAWRWVLSVGVPRADIRGQFQDYLGFCIDVSREKQLELERDELLHATDLAREQAELATRAKDEFLAKVSHELRNPLNGILGWTQVLVAPESTDDELRRGIQLVDNSARTLARLVDDLLDFSRILAGKMALALAPIRLETVIESACEEIRPALSAKGVELDFRTEGPLPRLLGDATRLHQVFWNLLSNAAKFTSRGGRVEIRTRRDGSAICVEVRDDGAGIDPAFLPHVFSAFRQAEAGPARGHSGLGLGLSIVSQLVERHGGTVVAESDGPGRGATFTVRLPLAAVDAPGEEAAVAHRGRLDGVAVVVVDDDAVAREMLATALGRAGAEVSAAASAAEAIEHLARSRPDVLVSDLEMPGEDGLALLRRVRALPSDRGGEVPAIALTAHAQPTDRAAALTAGFQDHLAKPVDIDELLRTVGRLARLRGVSGRQASS